MIDKLWPPKTHRVLLLHTVLTPEPGGGRLHRWCRRGHSSPPSRPSYTSQMKCHWGDLCSTTPKVWFYTGVIQAKLINLELQYSLVVQLLRCIIINVIHYIIIKIHYYYNGLHPADILQDGAILTHKCWINACWIKSLFLFSFLTKSILVAS